VIVQQILEVAVVSIKRIQRSCWQVLEWLQRTYSGSPDP
jgi:hypothetical protein